MSKPTKEQAAQRWRTDEELGKKLPPGVKLLRTLKGHRGAVNSVAFDPQSGMLASGGDDRKVKLWEARSGKLLRTLEGHTNVIWSVAFDPRGETLASGGYDDSVKLWKARSGKLVRTIKDDDAGTVYSVAFDPQGGTVVRGSAYKGIDFWDAQSGAFSRSLETFHGVLRSIAFDLQGEKLASGSYDDSMVKLWDARSGKLFRTLGGHQDSVYGVAFDPKGSTLASGSADRTVKLWEAKSGDLLRTLEGHTNEVYAVAFSPNGRLLASQSSDQTVRLWSCETWETVAIIPEATQEGVWSSALAFHRTLPLLATAGSDQGLIHVWELDFDLLLGKSVAPTVTYISAKVVLVGESNVGKSYLAHRIATGAAPEQGMIESTHGMKFWPLEPEKPGHAAAPSTEKKQGLPSVFTKKLFGQDAAVSKNQRRDIVLWDMGGQEEYRLIHQLFLHDTTVALVLLDPTRGATAFKEVEAWNKSLEKQLSGRAAVRLLVGAKVDRPSEMIDRQGLERLRQDCGFADYCETSAITGRGVEELCEALAKAIDWDSLGKTTRPELFQSIRDEIGSRKKRGVVVVLFEDLNQELHTNEESETFSLMQNEVAMASDAEAGTRALDAVCSQLAQQGTIARAKTSSGESALILRIEEVERYAGSLILAAKANQMDRGVPALELRTIAQEQFHFPQIAEGERLPRAEEKPIVECTVQLMLEHGICFQHEGLLIFPSLFAPAVSMPDEKLPHAVSLYYDFAGAIDNIYASLVAWLVLAKEFGKVRLWSDRAEFAVKHGGLCGLRKVARPGGFAHVDVYFEEDTPQRKQKEFISFVEDHLATNGVEIKERIVVPCPQGFVFDEETLRMCIAAGDKEVLCPRCKCSHSLTEGAAQSRERDSKITQHTWALRTEIEKLRGKITTQVVQALGKAEETDPATGPFRLLHLSDLHFTKDSPVSARLQWLLDDLKLEGGLGFKELDYLVISGDFTDKGNKEGFEKAYEFVSGLTQEFGLSAERCIFVPGNHDVCDLREAYDWRDKSDGLKGGEWVKQGDVILARNEEKYPLRLKAFSDTFYHKFLQRPYPLDCSTQGFPIPFWEAGIQFLTLNSCWQIDQFHRKRSGLHVEAVANAIKQAQKQEGDARKAGQLGADKPLLRIAVWHHAVAGPEQMKDTDFLGNLQKSGVRLGLHGDVHEMQREQVGYRHQKAIHIVGSGSFGARAEDRPESTPRLYNVLEIARDLKSAKVHTRGQPKPDGSWQGWYEWESPKGGDGRVAFYDITF